MCVQVRRAMRRNHHPPLFSVVSDTERLAEAAVARGVELDKPDRARINKIPHREMMELPLTVSERDGACLSQPAKIGWLQVPEQWLLQPEYVEGCRSFGK